MPDGSRAGILDRTNRIVGPGAAAIKYDILTALLVTAANGDAVEARLSLRLSLLITARYNWRTGTFAVGLKEMANMWGVTERTVKREMAEMRGRSWIAIEVPAARGRVAQYRININTVLRGTMPHWKAVGPDFVARMTGTSAVETEGEGTAKVVQLRPDHSVLPEDDGTGWTEAAIRLRTENPVMYRSWFAELRSLGIESGILTLEAPSPFVASYISTHYSNRILAALISCEVPVHRVEITPA